MASQARLTARYNTIRQAKNYIEMMPPLITSPFPKYQLLMKATELERIEAISDISEGRVEQGVTRLAENAAFSRNLIRESNTLVSHMVAVAMMQRDTRILSELMTKYPEIATKYSAQLMPMFETVLQQNTT